MILDFTHFKAGKMAKGCMAAAHKYSDELLIGVDDDSLTFAEKGFLCAVLLTTGCMLFNKITGDKNIKNEFKEMVNITMDDVLR